VGQLWVGIPEKKIGPWRDTGVEVRGPAVSDVEKAFADIWGLCGSSLPQEEIVQRAELAWAGEMDLRIVDTLPATAGMMRLDQLIAALAQDRLWLTDAYYAGTTSYVQSLRSAAQDGVDVRLLVPNASDIMVLKPLSRAGYRPLLEAGVRIFEWNGSMLHAKTAVADGKWARVGSTNLNIASWFGNCELDAVVENEGFGAEMEEMYLQDLTNATEVVLDESQKVRGVRPGPRRADVPKSGAGSSGRAAAGALRVGNAVGAAFTSRRVLEPVESRLMLIAGFLILGLAVLFWFFPLGLVYPLIAIMSWFAISLFARSFKLLRGFIR
jgi:cardiolipin synthase